MSHNRVQTSLTFDIGKQTNLKHLNRMTLAIKQTTGVWSEYNVGGFQLEGIIIFTIVAFLFIIYLRDQWYLFEYIWFKGQMTK